MPKITELPTDTAPEAADLVPFVDTTASRTEAVTLSNLAASAPFSTAYAPITGSGEYVSATEIVCGEVLTAETTTSGTATDLSTSGPDAVVTVPASGRVLVRLGAGISNSGAGNIGIMSVALSGANTVAANDDDAVAFTSAVATNLAQGMIEFELTGLTPGVTTFRAKYRVTAGTGTFRRRRITVVPLP